MGLRLDGLALCQARIRVYDLSIQIFCTVFIWPKKKKGNSKRMILVDDLLLVLEIAEADAEYVVRKV